MSTEALSLMLADLRWTRRLALALARDGAEADDLWSETWSAAGREHKPVHRGWIATTMRNLQRMRRRAEKRRVQRELATADLRDEPTTPEELLARVELQKTLAELMTTLGEPYRTTMLLHHVEDLAPVEIAERLAIPAGTVRWRLKVAHDELRQRLIARSGGDRDAWRLALMPLFPRGAQPPIDARAQPPEPGAPAKGGPTMMTWNLLALLGSFLAVGGFALRGTHAVPAKVVSAAAPPPGSAPTAPAAATAGGAHAAGAPTSGGKPKANAKPSGGKCDDCEHHRAFAVPSAAIADFEAPDLDGCFSALPVAPNAYRRVDMTLGLSRANGIATISDAKVKYMTDEVAKVPGVGECLKRTLIGHDMPDPTSTGPAELAILLTDSQGHPVPDEHPPAKVSSDAQAPFLGEAGAPLTLSVFTDFQCPFCWRYAARLQSLAELYPGQVRIEIRNMPLPFHGQAELAAEAALAAQAQGKFWPMHDELFAHQTSLDREHIRQMAAKIGLDVARFEQALDSGSERARVQRDIDLAKKLGINGVPSTVVGDELVVGARPLEELVRVVDRALATHRK
jgi:RNA polymerase sigma factor (sigma-70 family)